jgi:hypothetical protein
MSRFLSRCSTNYGTLERRLLTDWSNVFPIRVLSNSNDQRPVVISVAKFGFMTPIANIFVKYTPNISIRHTSGCSAELIRAS